ncbi:hypothetical protein VCB98_09715 [Gammaproteobacteria bacterium AB-CW1]|uniref:Polyketide cyclase/dehydrase n=1 Tax=Natronospira elongata TaxID=3110268 RepID=A0AAP6MN49_9GAMM|nr:hypothetical protein [Gammaproteobacteria bacterium AB-CW1]
MNQEADNKAKKRWLTVAVVSGLIVLVLGIGMLLPAEQTVKRSLAMQAPELVIYQTLTQPKRYSRWLPWLQRDPTFNTRQEGAEQGEGAVFVWEGGQGRQSEGRLEIDRTERGAFIIHRLQLGTHVEARGRFEIEPERGRYRVTWRVTRDVGLNPLRRYQAIMFEDRLGSDLLSGLTYLKVYVETQRSPFPDE